MSKRGEAALYVFLAFSVIALAGLTYAMLDGATGMAYRGAPLETMPLNPQQFPDYYAQYGGGYEPPENQPGNYMISTPGSVTDLQSQCFGTEPGVPRIEQPAPLGGAELRKCLADAQAGTPYHQQVGQECYTCSGVPEGITADFMSQAVKVCKDVGGADSTVIKVEDDPCNYS